MPGYPRGRRREELRAGQILNQLVDWPWPRHTAESEAHDLFQSPRLRYQGSSRLSGHYTIS